MPDFEIEDGLSLIESRLPSTSLELLLFQSKEEFSKLQSLKQKIAKYKDKFVNILNEVNETFRKIRRISNQI